MLLIVGPIVHELGKIKLWLLEVFDFFKAELLKSESFGAVLAYFLANLFQEKKSIVIFFNIICFF